MSLGRTAAQPRAVGPPEQRTGELPSQWEKSDVNVLPYCSR